MAKVGIMKTVVHVSGWSVKKERDIGVTKDGGGGVNVQVLRLIGLSPEPRLHLVHIMHHYFVPKPLLIYYATDHLADHWSRSRSHDYQIFRVNIKVLR